MTLPDEPDYLAPDGSEIRLLPSGARGGMAHCLLPPGGVSSPVRHRTVEEIWYCVSGTGELWRRYGSTETRVELRPGVGAYIGFRTAFQFRNTGSEDLVMLLATFPGWPGAEEAVPVAEGAWPTSSG
jgi:mannose-6-phosphate isomerase-like protein (cupin superfamily)